MAPVSGHMHLHDSFGRPTTVRKFYSDAERVAYGMGDLHLPLGWGAIPFETLLPGKPFLPGTVMIVELPRSLLGRDRRLRRASPAAHGAVQQRRLKASTYGSFLLS